MGEYINRWERVSVCLAVLKNKQTKQNYVEKSLFGVELLTGLESPVQILQEFILSAFLLRQELL